MEIFKLIEQTHDRGNPTKFEWLVNAADRLASDMQRNDVHTGLEFVQLNENVKRKLIAQMKKHFLLHGTDINQLRKFIERSRLLESIPADKSDANHTTLREHLLVTENVLQLLLEIPQPRNIAQWVKTKKVKKFVLGKLKPVKRLDVTRVTPDKITPDARLRKAVEFAMNEGWTEARIAMMMEMTLKDVRKIIAVLR